MAPSVRAFSLLNLRGRGYDKRYLCELSDEINFKNARTKETQDKYQQHNLSNKRCHRITKASTGAISLLLLLLLLPHVLLAFFAYRSVFAFVCSFRSCFPLFLLFLLSSATSLYR